jgi:hypothetical protein
MPLWISVPLWFVLMGLGGLPALALIGWLMQPIVEPRVGMAPKCPFGCTETCRAWPQGCPFRGSK